MEDLLFYTSIVVIIFGILEIILFFKVWGMTNDVKKLKNTVLKDISPGISPAHIELIIGNKEKVKEMAYKEFILDVHELYMNVSKNKLISEEEDYIKGFENLENRYKERYADASSLIKFSEFSTYENAKKMFK